MVILLFTSFCVEINANASETDGLIWDEGVSVESEFGTVYATSQMLIRVEAKIRTLANDLKVCEGFSSEVGSSYYFWSMSYKQDFSGNGIILVYGKFELEMLILYMVLIVHMLLIMNIYI